MRKLLLKLIIISFACFTFAYAQNYNYFAKVSIKQLFDEAMAAKAFPGGCIVAGTVDQTFIDQCFGYQTYAKLKTDTPDSIFDLASLTKVVATTAAVMKLFEEGKIHLNDKVIDYLPQFTGSNTAQTKLKATITIKDLLAHTSGLPPDLRFVNWNKIYLAPVVVHPGQVEIYSDINFLLLGKIVEKISGMSLEEYTQKYIFKPLAMEHTIFNPGKKYLSITIPTTFDLHSNSYLTGIVDDPMARKLSGSSGNAGLFSNMHDLAIFARMMLNGGNYQGQQIFTPATIMLFTKRVNLVKKSSRALGWDTVVNPDAAAILKVNYDYYHHTHIQFTPGIYIDGDAYGHTGFTGVSMWISPKYGIYVILLTNRVIPYVCNATKQAEMYYRQQINSAIWQNLGFNTRNILPELAKPIINRSSPWRCP